MVVRGCEAADPLHTLCMQTFLDLFQQSESPVSIFIATS